MRIGYRLRRKRIALGLSRRDLAERSGMAATTLARIERNAQQPLPATVQALAIALGTDVATLAPRWRKGEEHRVKSGVVHPGYGLRILRERAGVTLTAAARAAGVAITTLSRFERCLIRSRKFCDHADRIASDPLALLLGFADAAALQAACAAMEEPGSAPPDDDPPPDDLGMMECR